MIEFKVLQLEGIMTKKVKKSCVVIGDGVAANTFIFYLLKATSDIEVTQFFNESLFPKSSIKSTAIVANRNVPDGISEYGDLLNKSFIELERFYEKYKQQFFDDIEIITHREYGNGVDYHRKYPQAQRSKYGYVYSEDAYLFYPEEYLKRLRSLNQNTRVEKAICDYGQLSDYDLVVDCSGHYLKYFNPALDSKVTSGAYLSTRFDFKHSFSITMDHCNLIFRKKYNQLIIGSSTGNEIIAMKDFEHLKASFKTLKEYDFELPSFSEFDLVRSFRHKMIKRLPVWKEFSDNVYVNGGYFKNGYQFSLLAAKELSEMIVEKI